jgi:hypothetical protein
MIFEERDLQNAEQRLGVSLPPSFRNFVSAHSLGEFISADVLHPTKWWRIRNDDKYRGPPGIVFAEGVGGDYWLLLADEGRPDTLASTVWTWDFHEGASPKIVARTIGELSSVIEKLADTLLGVVAPD